MKYNIYRLLFGNSDHLHGNVFHTVPGKKRKHKKKTQNQYSSGLICCVHSNTTTIKVSLRLHSYYYNINIGLPAHEAVFNFFEDKS